MFNMYTLGLPFAGSLIRGNTLTDLPRKILSYKQQIKDELYQIVYSPSKKAFMSIFLMRSMAVLLILFLMWISVPHSNSNYTQQLKVSPLPVDPPTHPPPPPPPIKDTLYKGTLVVPIVQLFNLVFPL